MKALGIAKRAWFSFPLLALAVFFVGLVVVAGSAPPAAQATAPLLFGATNTPTPCVPSTRQVLMTDFFFSPQTLTVTQGSTINWFNEGPTLHTTTSDTGVWDSGNINPGSSYQFTFGSPGTYPYHCTLHLGMTGTVVVTDCGQPTPTATPSCPLQWRLVSSANSGTLDNHLLGVDAVSANDVWAVGYYYDGFAGRTLALHWNGTAWSVVPSPNVGSSGNSLQAVAAVSANDVWAVGTSGVQTLIEHWNGGSWSVVSSPSPGVSFNNLNGIEVVAPDNIWAVGNYYNGSVYRTLIEHWNGGGWSVVTSPNVGADNNFLWGGISALSAGDIWAVGSYGPSGSGRTLIVHWNGTAWSVVPSPNVGTSENRLIGAAGVSPGDVWAVGFYGASGTEQTLIEHWDGTAWSVVPSPNPGTRNELLAAVATWANDVWAVGFTGGGTLATLAQHWDGSAWSVVSSPNPAGSTTNLLQAVSALSDSHIWAVGDARANNVYKTLAMRYSLVGTGCATATVTRTPTHTPTTTPTPVCPPVTRQVFMFNTTFSPSTISITQGSTISWFNEGPFAHTSTSDTGVWDSGNVNPGFSYQFTFNAPGIYPYHCTIHPQMTGSVIVQPCGTATPTPTVTATPVPRLVGHVNWEARPPQPHQQQVLPITLTLKMGATEINYPTQLTDQYGFFTVTVGTLPGGTYGWRVDDSTTALHSPNYLAKSGVVSLGGAPVTNVEMGLIRTGDANNDNIVNLFDFNIVKVAFATSCPDPNYDNRADFTGDCLINIADFNPLKANFGQGGSPPLRTED
jgi:plastocyanin